MKPSSGSESGDSEIENKNSQKSLDFADFETFPQNFEISAQIDEISINSSHSSAKEIEHEVTIHPSPPCPFFSIILFLGNYRVKFAEWSRCSWAKSERFGSGNDVIDDIINVTNRTEERKRN